MCGGSKSSSSQSTSTTNQDNRIAGGEGHVFSEIGGSVTVESIDPQTIEQAFNAINLQNSEIFEFATSFFDKAVTTTQEAVAGSFTQSAELTKELFQENNTPGIEKYAGIASLGFVAVIVWLLGKD